MGEGGDDLAVPAPPLLQQWPAVGGSCNPRAGRSGGAGREGPVRAGPCLPAQLAASLLPRGARSWQWGLGEPPDWALAPDRVREGEHGSLARSCLSVCPPVQEVPASPCPHPAWAGGRAWGALGWAQSKGLLFLLTCRTD